MEIPELAEVIDSMEEFVCKLEPHHPQPYRVGVDGEGEGYIIWRDGVSSAVLELVFVGGRAPAMFIGSEDDEPEYVGYYCPFTKHCLDQYITLMGESAQCH